MRDLIQSNPLTRLVGAGLIGLMLAGCSDPHRGPRGDGNRDGTRIGSDRGDAGSRPGNGAGNDSSQSCTYQLIGVINTPSRLENTRSGCDYQLVGEVRIESDLLVDPGVTVRAEPDAMLLVDGGRIEARGDPANRIVFTSLSGDSGYWGGIQIERGLRSQFEYVDISNVASRCTQSDCEHGGLVVNSATLSMKHSSISGSLDHGLVILGQGRLEQFVDNRFQSNLGAPVVLPGYAAHVLDTATDYDGGNRPNAQPHILITAAEQTANLILRWKRLEVPYRIESSYLVSDGTLLLEPGVIVEFSRDARLDVRDNGAIDAVGMANNLITLRGVDDEPGYWNGLNLTDSPWRENTLRYIDILNAGKSGAAGGGIESSIHLDNSSISLRNGLIANNLGVGISCDAPSTDETASTVSIDTDSLISGGIGDHCQVID